MKLVVLAAGAGTRMGPLTRNRPKVLLPVAGATMLEHVLQQAVAAGFDETILVVHHHSRSVRAAIGDGTRFGLNIEYVEQGDAGGTGHALAAACDRLDGDFVLTGGDCWLNSKDLKRVRDAPGGAIAAARVDDVRSYGVLTVDGRRLVAIDEKPTGQAAGLVNAGVYRLPLEVAQACASLPASARGEKELTDAVASHLLEHDVQVVETPSWTEAGRPWALLDMQARIMDGITPEIGGRLGDRVDVEGTIRLGPGARIENGTRIEGPVAIGANARIGPNAYIRGPTSIGRGCHVGAGVEIKNSILGDASHVPHLSYVGDSVLGRDCNLGAGTQVANLKLNGRDVRVHWEARQWIDTKRRKLGAILGDGVKTGVNASLNPGTVLGCDAVVGAGVAASGWVADGEHVLS